MINEQVHADGAEWERWKQYGDNHHEVRMLRNALDNRHWIIQARTVHGFWETVETYQGAREEDVRFMDAIDRARRGEFKLEGWF